MCKVCANRGTVSVRDWRGRHEAVCPRCRGKQSWWSRFIEWLKGLA